jgi:hypothetical protein
MSLRIALSLLLIQLLISPVRSDAASVTDGTFATPTGDQSFTSQGTGTRLTGGYFNPTQIPPVSATTQATPTRRSAPSHRLVSDVDFDRAKAASIAAIPRLSPTSVQELAGRPDLTASVGTYEGIDANLLTNPYLPSDGAIASNGSEIVYAANDKIEVRSLVSGLATSTWTFASFFSALGLPAGTSFADPRLVWDAFGNRFIFVVAAVDASIDDAWVCVATSTTSDGNSPWWIYALDTTYDGANPTSNWGDYPTLGIDNQAVYIGTNQVSFLTGLWTYSKLRIVNKGALESGTLSSWYDFWGAALQNADGSYANTIQPATNETVPGAEILASSTWNGGSFLTRWSLSNPLTTPTLNRATVNVAPYYMPVGATQPGGVQYLDAGDNRLGQVIARNGVIWTSLTSGINFGYGNVDAIRFFEISAAAPSLVIDDWAGYSNANAFFGSVGVDTFGNAIVVFLCSSASMYASICASSHGAAEPPTTMDATQQLVNGAFSYEQLDSTGKNRWGDYTAAALDPNGITIWTYGEYAPYPFNLWGTRADGLVYYAAALPSSTPTPTATPPSYSIYLPAVFDNTGW